MDTFLPASGPHDGDTVNIGNDLFLEYIQTQERIAIRLTNRVGYGVLIYKDSFHRLCEAMIWAS